MKQTEDISHVRIGGNAEGQHVLACWNCGAELKLVSPLTFKDLQATSNAFLAGHRRCKPKKKGAPR